MLLPKKLMMLLKKYWRKMMNKKKEKEKTMDIPQDLIMEIFLRLPVQSLLRFRWVCKSWFNFIIDPSFVNMQLYYSSHKPNNNPLVLIYYNNQHNRKLIYYNIMDCTNDDHNTCLYSLVSVKGPSVNAYSSSFKILGSCNGLWCMGVPTCVHETYFIWNPCTKEYKMASNHRNDLCCGNSYGEDYVCYNTYGFGYDRTIDDYKLVKTTTLNRHNGDYCKTCVYVYTLGTNSWKTVGSSYEEFTLSTIYEQGKIIGLFISGHLYYTAKKISSTTFDIIVSFDIAKEEYRQIPIPDKVGISHPVMNLGELKGRLCLLCSTIVLNGRCEVWMMRHNVETNMDVKEEYTWEKLYTISPVIGSCNNTLITKLLRICKNGEILMVMNSGFNYWKKIVLYDPKSGKITVLHEVDFAASVENYIESLVCLNSGTYLLK